MWLYLYLWGGDLASTMGVPWVTRAQDFGPRVHHWHEQPLSLPEYHHTVALVTRHTLGFATLIPLVMSGNPTVPYVELKRRIDPSRIGDRGGRKILRARVHHFKTRCTQGSLTLRTEDYMSRTPVYRADLLLSFKSFRVQLDILALEDCPSSVRQITLDCFRAALDVVQHPVTEPAAAASLRHMINNITAILLAKLHY